MALVGDDVAIVLDDLAGLTLPEKRLHQCNVILPVSLAFPPARRTSDAWRDFFALRDQAEVPADFMNGRPLNEPLKPRKFFEDR